MHIVPFHVFFDFSILAQFVLRCTSASSFSLEQSECGLHRTVAPKMRLDSTVAIVPTVSMHKVDT